MSKIIPAVLVKLRESRRFSQAELAEAAKVDPQTISRLERGTQKGTRASTVKKLAGALKVEAAVLTGNSPMPEIAPAPQKSSANIELSREADNALHLVARRYGVGRWQIMEAAPLLFCWAAELSLRQRRHHINEIERTCDIARSLESELLHLPVPNFTYSEEKIAAENTSIDSHDIMGQFINEDDFLDGYFPSQHGMDNPFARFLTKEIESLGGVATLEEFTPDGYPIYRVCPDEAAEIVGGDKERSEEILKGYALLSEMPKELTGIHALFGKTAEKAAWVQEQAKQYLASLLGKL